jgi:hypothetical protein
MTGWTPDQLAAVADADELTIQPQRSDGTLRRPVPIWVVRVGDDLYVRSYRGTGGAWFRDANTQLAGRISAGGVTADVSFAAERDEEVNDRIDAVYIAKYRRHGPQYVAAMVAADARATTLKLTPR